MKERIERLSKYLEYKGINDNQATIICGLSKGLIGKARTGKVDIGKVACDKILDKFQDLSKVWLLTGEGEMLKPSQDSDNSVPDGDDEIALLRLYRIELMAENARLKTKIATLGELDEHMAMLNAKLNKIGEDVVYVVYGLIVNFLFMLLIIVILGITLLK